MKSRKYLIILTFISIISGFLIGAKISTNAQAKQEESSYKNLTLLAKVMHLLESTYVEEVDTKEIIHGGIRGMLSALDPHSVFLKPDDYKEMKESTVGKFGGLGIEVTKRDNYILVITPIEDTPAWQAGLKPLDKIIEIDGESALDMDLQVAVSKMRGKPNTKVKLKIAREGEKELLDFEITRKIIKIESVKQMMLPENFAYIRISTFNENTTKNVKQAFLTLEKESKNSLKGILIDLRNNPGGLLDQAISTADLFLEKGVIVSVVGRNKDKKLIEYAKKETTITNLPIVILVNQSSASAAEILAGALQDNNRAVIIGQKTFGKGSVQTLVELDDSSAIKYTIARYYTPNDYSIQAKGIEPNIEVLPVDPKVLEDEKVIKKTYDQYGEASLKGHIEGEEEKVNQIYERAKKGLKDKMEKQDLTKVIDLDYDYQANMAYNYLKIYSLGLNKKGENK